MEWRTFTIRNPHSTFRISSGFTLVELLIVAAIFGGILLALFISFMIGQGTYLSSNAYIQVQEEARRALDAVGRELREAGGSITRVAGPPDTLRFQVALGFNRTDIPGCETKVNLICWGAQDPATNASRGDRCVQYRVVGTQLVREVVDGVSGTSCGTTVQGPARVLANNIVPNTMTFVYAGGSTQTVTVNLQTQVQPPAQGLGNAQTSGPLQTQVRLRN